MKKIIISLWLLLASLADAQTFTVNNLTATGLIQNAAGSGTTPTYNFTGGTTTGLYFASPGIGFSVAGSSVGKITSTGLNNIAIGATTPSSVAATTISATTPIPIGSGGTGNTSGTATINANLTGVITSVGNATSIASQTGTGSKFVVDTSPVLVTPNLGTPSAGVATNLTGTATALNIGGNAATATTATNLSGGSVSATSITASAGVTLSPASSNVVLSPTGTGVVTINPATAGTLNNVSVGQSTAAAVTGTTLTASTGAITPHYPAGIVGVASGSAVTAGSIGEIKTATGSAVSITTGTSKTITSVTLSAGNWLLIASIQFTPAGSTLMAGAFAGISTTDNALPSVPLLAGSNTAQNAGQQVAFSIPSIVVNTSGTPVYYCVGNSSFSTSTETATCTLTAIRIS